MSKLITFEHPLNERTRTFLRLEHLYDQLTYFVDHRDPRSWRSAIAALLDITAATARSDVKNELIKELERHIVTVQGMANQRGVDPDALNRVVGDLRAASDQVKAINGPIGHAARDDEFLKAIGQRSSIPGGTCSFDLPHFHYWLIQPPEFLAARFEEWLQDLQPLMDGLRLSLSLVRGSCPSRQVVAEGGFYQEELDPLASAQMIKVAVDGDEGLYPEISGHKNRFSIRFMTADVHGRALAHTDDVPFRLTCCIF